MTAHVSPDAPRPPDGIRDSGGPMPFNEADFTRTAAELVAEGDRVPTQREPVEVIAELARIAAELDDIAEWDRETAFCRDEAQAVRRVIESLSAASGRMGA